MLLHVQSPSFCSSYTPGSSCFLTPVLPGSLDLYLADRDGHICLSSFVPPASKRMAFSRSKRNTDSDLQKEWIENLSGSWTIEPEWIDVESPKVLARWSKGAQAVVQLRKIVHVGSFSRYRSNSNPAASESCIKKFQDLFLCRGLKRLTDGEINWANQAMNDDRVLTQWP